MIDAAAIEDRLAGLDAIGRRDDGFHRLAWTAADEAAGAWFDAQAAAVGLRVERDGAGNRWACPDAPPPWWGVGSHLDTVAGGGRYDGALGVVCAFAIAAVSPVPVAVVAFADEEGARFNTPTFGSRALAGRLDLADVLDRRDDDGVALADALAGAGVDPAGVRAREHLVDVQPADQRAAAEGRRVEARALLVGEGDDRDGDRRRLRDRERARDAERAVVAAAARHRVEVRADAPPRRRTGGTGPAVAGGVALDA